VYWSDDFFGGVQIQQRGSLHHDGDDDIALESREGFR
jgi:hypothetical protein